MGGNGNDNNLRRQEMCGGMYTKWDCLTEEERREVRSNASRKAWATRRANARRRDYQARAAKAWATRRARENYGHEDQGTLRSRVLNQYN